MPAAPRWRRAPRPGPPPGRGAAPGRARCSHPAWEAPAPGPPPRSTRRPGGAAAAGPVRAESRHRKGEAPSAAPSGCCGRPRAPPPRRPLLAALDRAPSPVARGRYGSMRPARMERIRGLLEWWRGRRIPEPESMDDAAEGEAYAGAAAERHLARLDAGAALRSARLAAGAKRGIDLGCGPGSIT